MNFLEVAKEENEEADVEVRFLRKHTKVPNDFVEPDVEDIHSVPVRCVVLILPQPSTSGSTKRATAIKNLPPIFPAITCDLCIVMRKFQCMTNLCCSHQLLMKSL